MRWMSLLLAVLSTALARLASAHEPIVIQPGAEGEDTAVYHFLPFLARGDYPTLYAFTIAEDNQAHDFRTFLRFPIPAELAGACLESAEVFVYYGFDASGFGSGENVPGTVLCEPVLAAWTEAAMTWANQPPIGDALDAIENVTSFRFLGFDVTALAQSWVDGAPNYGVALSSPTARGMGFYSFEAQVDALLRPALSITVADDPQACPETAAAVPAALAVLAIQRVRRRR
jgi:hypothetical protein